MMWSTAMYNYREMGMTKHQSTNLQRYFSATCLMNSNYSTLLSKKRTYAAFNDVETTPDEITPRKCAQMLADHGISEVLDPMAGYGTILQYGRKSDFGSFLVEINLPAHLWQLIAQPENSEKLITIVNKIIAAKDIWPVPKCLAEVSNEWIGSEGLRILCLLYDLNRNIVAPFFDDTIIVEKMALAIMLPIVLRLSTAQKGDAAYVKRNGGVSILKGYDADYHFYLNNMLLPFLEDNFKEYSQVIWGEEKWGNTCIYGNAMSYNFPQDRFHGMLTSPPYPNGSDYGKMFSAENFFIDDLSRKNLIHFEIIPSQIIGTNTVKDRQAEQLTLQTAKVFLGKLRNLKLNKKAKMDMLSYYIPYYRNYFCDLEKAYRNISTALSERFLGYIIVTNNAIRNIEVPVSDFIIELWQSLGFNAKCIKSKEVSHVGAKNPHAKGRMSLHCEHIIQIWRGGDV